MKERRFVRGAEVRAVAESGHIDGHAAVFNEVYVLVDYPDFRVEEIIKPGAFDRAIREKQDVRALFNHDPNYILGRTTAGTLSLKEDKRGLYFDNTPPDTQVGRDVRTSIDRGDISGCSFAFEVLKQTRTEEMVDKQLIVTRTVEDVNLYDVGPVTYPAYESTDVNARQVDFRGLFPNGYPSQLRKHIGDLGLPPDLQRKVPIKSKKRAVTIDMTPEEMQSMIDDMETKMDDMTSSMADMQKNCDAMQTSMDAMEEKLTGAKEMQGAAETNAKKANEQLIEERKVINALGAAFKEEKAGIAVWMQRTLESVNAITTACRTGLAEVKKRAQLAAGMNQKLTECRERLVALEGALGEERALLFATEVTIDWAGVLDQLRAAVTRERAESDKLQQRSGALALIEERLSTLVTAVNQERTLLGSVEVVDLGAVPLNQLYDTVKRISNDFGNKIHSRVAALTLLEERLTILTNSLKQERTLLGTVEVQPDWKPILTQASDAIKRESGFAEKVVQRSAGLEKLAKQLAEERAVLQQIQEIDPNWRVFSEDLEKVLQQSTEAASELTRRTRLWE